MSRRYHGGLLSERGGGYLRTGSSAAPISTDPPVNTVAPVVTGDPFVGETLTCSTGTWTGSPYLTINVDGVNVSTANGFAPSGTRSFTNVPSNIYRITFELMPTF